MITVSLCMIVRDEEEVLARCLDSVKDLVDEIIIVDTGSKDHTKEIAAAYTDKIYDYSWEEDFSAARNYAFSKASMDYQMWLDADDVIGPEEQKKFKALKESVEKRRPDMVMMRYHAAFDGEGAPTMTYYRERLMRRERNFQFAGAVHEAVVPSGDVMYTDTAVWHKKLCPSDPDRNLRIYEKALKNGETLDARQQYYYARELLFHERYQEAAKLLERFLKEGKGWVENEIGACLDLSYCLTRLGENEKALEALFSSFVYDAPRPEICCAIGNILMEQGRYVQAVYWFTRAAEDETAGDAGGFSFPDCRGFFPYMQMCVCYHRLGEHEKSRLCHEKAKRLKPKEPAVLYNESYFNKDGVH